MNLDVFKKVTDYWQEQYYLNLSACLSNVQLDKEDELESNSNVIEAYLTSINEELRAESQIKTFIYELIWDGSRWEISRNYFRNDIAALAYMNYAINLHEVNERIIYGVIEEEGFSQIEISSNDEVYCFYELPHYTMIYSKGHISKAWIEYIKLWWVSTKRNLLFKKNGGSKDVHMVY